MLDTETTGFVPRVHHVIEYAAVRVEKGEVADTYEQLFSVKEEIPPHVQVLTRIRPEDIAEKPVFDEKREEIEQRLAGVDLLVGQNLSFDIGMLRGEGIDLSERPWVDTSMLASLVFPEFRSYSLQYMSATLNLNHEPAHRALGDVRATLEMFARIWERLLELPPEQLAFAKDVMGRSTDGYRLLFDALPQSTSERAAWIVPQTRPDTGATGGSVRLDPPPAGTVELHEEGLDANCLQDILNGSAEDGEVRRWIAVKNLENALKRIRVPEGVTVIHPPQLLLNPEALPALAAQETYTPEEALLRLKIEWFRPRTRNDLAVHGGERDYWSGRLACTARSPAYADQFRAPSRACLLDHGQLLSILNDPDHPARAAASGGALTPECHIVIDDASMLEDTATKAYGHFVSLDSMRAGAGSDESLVRFTDLLALFCERTRRQEDQYFLAAADLRHTEAALLREHAGTLLARTDLPSRMTEQLKQTAALLHENLPESQIVWIERRMDGALTLQSAPKHADALLRRDLYERYPTTLLVPKGGNGVLPEIVPPNMPARTDSGEGFAPCPLTVTFPVDLSLTTFLHNPPPGKTIVLAGSKRVIEQAFIQHTETLEKEGITLICQGMSGGQGRMESDFLAAPSPALLLVTPFMYEGLDFPADTADRLVLDTVPFDHPNNPVMKRRKERYRNAFNEYAMPRLEYRLFRLMRAFCRHKREGAEMMVFDKRLVEKDYGARLQRYMAQFAAASDPVVQAPPPARKRTPKQRNDGQLQMPL